MTVVVADLIDEAVGPSPAGGWRVSDLAIGRVDAHRAMGWGGGRHHSGRNQVAVKVRIVEQDVDGHCHIFLGVGRIIRRGWQCVDSQIHLACIAQAVVVAYLVGEQVVAEKITVGCVGDHARDRIHCHRAVQWAGDRRHRCGVDGTVGIGVIGQHIDGHSSPVRRRRIVVLGHWQSQHSHRDRGRAAQGLVVAHPVVKVVQAVVAAVGRVDDLPTTHGCRAVERIGHGNQAACIDGSV